jgi:hypothetical protein
MSERSLDGLKQLMIVKSRAVLPFLVPHLTQPPVDIQSLCALCSCASIDVLGRHLNKVLVTLVHALAAVNTTIDLSLATANPTDEQQKKAEAAAAAKSGWVSDCEMLLVSVHEADGVRSIISDLLTQIANATTSDQLPIRCAALDMLNWFCAKTEADYSPHYDELIKSMLQLLAETSEAVLTRAWSCLNAVVETLKADGEDSGPAVFIQRLPGIRQTLRIMTQFNLSNQTIRHFALTMCEPSGGDSALYALPGFCLPKRGIACLLPIFKESLLNGPPDVKEQSALTLAECIKLAR